MKTTIIIFAIVATIFMFFLNSLEKDEIEFQRNQALFESLYGD